MPERPKNISFQIERPLVVWRQIADQMRGKILGGEIAVGTKLPSTAELAKLADTDVKTIHRALTELVREGLITRARKIGTYVSERKSIMSPIGIYHSANIVAERSSLFLQCLHGELQRQAHAKGIATRSWVDQRSRQQQETVLPELDEAIRNRDIVGLISSVADPLHRAWLDKLRVPVAYNGAFVPSSVKWDTEQLVDISIETLQNQGCRSIGVITTLRQDHRPVFHERLRSKLIELGLHTREEWLLQPDKGVTEEEAHAFGYNAFNQLWSQSEKPDGILVYPDGVARGVVMAAIAQGSSAQIPKLVLHKNEEIGLFCPFPTAFVVSRVSDCAAALLKQLDTQFHGKPAQPVFLNFHIDLPVS